MLALELDGDGLDEGVLDVLVLDPAADRLDELEELLGLPLGFADDEHVRVDLVVALVQLVEEHVNSMVRSPSAGQYTTDSRWRPAPRRPVNDPPIEVVHVGSASRDLTDDDPRGWRLGRRRDVRRADDRPARPADGR